MSESVIDDILRHERYLMAMNALTGKEPPVWHDDIGLYLKHMTLLERVSYRNWRHAHPDEPHRQGELFRRVACDRDGTLYFRDESPAAVEEAVDTFTLVVAFSHAVTMWWGTPGIAYPPPPRTDGGFGGER